MVTYLVLLGSIVLWSMCSTDRINPCDDFNCVNGECVIGVDKQPTCQCAPGFSGARCDSPLDSCLLLDCQNGGTCDENFKNCLCPDGFVGPQCEFQNPCLLASCKNGYPCILDEDFIPTCDCGNEDEFFGPDCSTPNPCYQVACPTNSVCIDGVCECKVYYEGDNCEILMRTKFLGDYVVRTNDRRIQTITYRADTLVSDTTINSPDRPVAYDCSINAVEDSSGINLMTISYLEGAGDNIRSTVTTSRSFIITETPLSGNQTVGTASRAEIDLTQNPQEISLDYAITENQGDTLIIIDTYFTTLIRNE